MEKTAKITLSNNTIDSVVELLPKPRTMVKYKHIFSLSGRHWPCVTSYYHDLLQDRTMIHTEDARSANILCMTTAEAEMARSEINEIMDRLDFHARTDGRKLNITLPWHASARILAQNGAKTFCCNQHDGIESLIFATTDDFRIMDMKKKFKNTEKRFFKEYNMHCRYPDTYEKLQTGIILPEFTSHYEWDYLEFLIMNQSKLPQTKTFDSLYTLATHGIRITKLDERTLIKLVHAHNDTIGIRTLEKQLIKTSPDFIPLQKRIMDGCLTKMLSNNANLISSEDKPFA